jgi:ferrous iron transport protein B
LKKIAIVGNPNVGKSVLFNQLTGRYVMVSNYPGTTVEVSRGHATIDNVPYEVIDTPGMYTLLPLTEEERVAREILLHENPSVVLHVLDAKNMDRMLPLTFQLLETGFPVIVVLNMMDEFVKEGREVDCELLEEELGTPVVAATSILGQGIQHLKQRIRVLCPTV